MLSLTNETGHWEYFVVGPAEAKADGERQHPWWPETEQFIDFVSVRLADAELAEEVAKLRAGAASRYDRENAARPWPITFAKHMRSKAGFTQRTEEEYGTQKLAEAEDHNTRLAAEVRQEQHGEELIYMFRRLATLFLEVVDAELRNSYLLPHLPADDPATGVKCEPTEAQWICAPVAQIAAGTRQKCDVCETSILDRHWACCVEGCEWEVCMACHRQGERRRAARRQRIAREEGRAAQAQAPAGRSTVTSTLVREREREREGAHAPGGSASGEAVSRELTSRQRVAKPYDGDQGSLQSRIDLVFPALVSAEGEEWREFEALLPKEGKYAGQPCGTCRVVGCSMFGRVFHQKNLATHARPRGAGVKSSVFSRQHDNNYALFSSLFTKGTATAAEVELLMVENKEKLLAEQASANGARESDSEGEGADPLRKKLPRENGEKLMRVRKTQGRKRVPGNCPACRGKHRAHTCGKKLRRGGLSDGTPRPKKVVDQASRIRKADIAAARLRAEAGSWMQAGGDEFSNLDEGRRKRQKRAPVDADEYAFTASPSHGRTGGSTRRGSGAAHQVKQAAAANGGVVVVEEEEEEEEAGCFCDTDRHLLTNDISFEGVWIQCDDCSRWCHGECAGFDKVTAEEVETYSCPVCAAKPAPLLPAVSDHPLEGPAATSPPKSNDALHQLTSSASSGTMDVDVDAGSTTHGAGTSVQDSEVAQTASTAGKAVAGESHASHLDHPMEDAAQGPAVEAGGEVDDEAGSGEGGGEPSNLVRGQGEEGEESDGGEEGEEESEESEESEEGEEGGEESSGEEGEEGEEEEGCAVPLDEEDMRQGVSPVGDEHDELDEHDEHDEGGEEAVELVLPYDADAADVSEDEDDAYNFGGRQQAAKHQDDDDNDDDDDDDDLGDVGVSSDGEGSFDSDFGGREGDEVSGHLAEEQGSACIDRPMLSCEDAVDEARADVEMRRSDSGEEQCTWSQEEERAREGAEDDTRRLSGGSTVEEEGARQEAALELGRLFQGSSPPASADAAAPSAASVEGDSAPAAESEAPPHLPHGDGVVMAAVDAQAQQPTEEEASAAPLATPTEAQAAATGPVTRKCGTPGCTLAAKHPGLCEGEERAGRRMAVEAAAPAGGEEPASASAAADAGDAEAEASVGPSQSSKANATDPSHLLGRRGGGATLPVGGAVQVARSDSEHLGQRGRVVSAKCGYYQIQLPGPTHAHFRGRDLLLVDEDGNVAPVSAPPAPPPRPAASEPCAAPSTRTGEPEAPKWWWQSWEGEQGSRKRKPTQLYEAESSTAHTRQIRGGPYAEEEDEPEEPLASSAPRAPSVSAYNISVGEQVQVLKAGEYHGSVGDVVGMHNGYYQVQMEAGELINVRGKDLARGRTSGQVLAPRAQGQSQPPQRPMESQRPSAKLPTSARSAARKQERHSTELGIGHLVKVRRQGANYGRDGKVVAARNGYLIVQLGSSSAQTYFRSKDLVRLGSKGAAFEAIGAQPGGAAPRGRPPKPQQQQRGRQPRMTWRGQTADEGEGEETPLHEHTYVAAIKMPPSFIGELLVRVEHLLVLHPPEVVTPQEEAQLPEGFFDGERLRLRCPPPASGEPPGSPPLSSFRERWRRGEPVVVERRNDHLRLKWGPHGFLQRFGAEKVQMTDCRDGKSVHWLTLAHFFAGYSHPWTRALCPDTFRRMMLKLKDWPPDQDFCAKMPEYFEDLMQALPFPQYTHRDGILNLAKYFPSQFVPPDLGPKMYNAFGRHAAWQGMDPNTKKGGHTNLHCDVADAVNMMVDVGVHARGEEGDSDEEESLESESLHDDDLGELSSQHGAIWDIWRWEDSDAILQLLHAVARERDVEITNNPIHDQLFYLDAPLRRRLRQEYNVRGWRFIQRHGDAVFIPAGCPHQVRDS